MGNSEIKTIVDFDRDKLNQSIPAHEMLHK